MDDYLSHVVPTLGKNGLHLIASVLRTEQGESGRTSKGSLVRNVRVWIALRLLHLASGEWIEVVGIGEGSDSSDKASAKAITSARQAAMALMFNFGGLSQDAEAQQIEEKAAAAAAAEQVAQRLADLEWVKTNLPQIAAAKETTQGDLVTKWLKHYNVTEMSQLNAVQASQLRARCERELGVEPQQQQQQQGRDGERRNDRRGGRGNWTQRQRNER
jgi:hypothetical protein